MFGEKKSNIEKAQEQLQSVLDVLGNPTSNWESRAHVLESFVASLEPLRPEELRKISFDVNRKEFSEHTGIPVRTLEDWEAGRRTPPEYIPRLLSYQLKYEELVGKDAE